jgi:transposase
MYEDEALFKQSGSIYRHWARKGIGSNVKSYPGRKSVKVIGAVAIQEQPKFHFRFVEVFNTHTYLTFLKQLVRQYKDRKIHLIADNARWHKSPEIREWVSANSAKIELHFLPPYSPEHNAAEYVWKETRRWATHNRYFKDVGSLKDKLFRRFNRFQGNPASLRDLVAPFA